LLFAELHVVSVVDLSPAGSGRMVIALAVLRGCWRLLSWQTMEPGKFRSLTWVLLGFFAFRVILGRLRSR
jgi:cytochrome b561